MDDDRLSKDVDAGVKAVSSLAKGIFVAWLAYCAFGLGVAAAIIYVAAHFIIKFW